MLIQSALPGSFEGACENSICNCTLVEICKKCCSCEQGSQSREEQLPLMDGESNKGSTHLSGSQLSSVSTMDKFVPLVVYKSRRARTKSASDSSAQTAARLSDGCSNISSEIPSRVAEGSASLRTEVEETGDCSSSSALVVVGSQDHLSEGDICISIIKNHWLAKGLWPPKDQRSNIPSTMSSSSIRKCNACQIEAMTVEMLICDECEEAFHFSCCNPRIKKMPIGEWFCFSCLKKKQKLLKKSSANKLRVKQSGVRRSEDEISVDDLDPIASLLIGIVPYTPRVRIGQDYQADVPSWSGPSLGDVEAVGEPLEIDSVECLSLHNGSNVHRNFSAVNNWVQCRQLIQGTGSKSDGLICRKWRRAPLFEVQTDSWECFRCIHWDPAYADCAVPQEEMKPEDILKQRKSAEMARRSLTIKKRKLGQAKNGENKEDMKKIRS